MFILSGMLSLMAALPASSTKQLQSFSFGTGGTGGSGSTNYKVNGLSGEQSNSQISQSPHAAGTGDNFTLNASVPLVTISNSSTTYYNKLLVTIDTQNNPSDTLYAVAISTDNFVTTNYIKSDGTISASLTYPTDYRTYASWGSGSGAFVIGLASNTTYYVKAKAIQGNYTESAYGPVSSAATVAPQLSFSVSPSSVAFGTLNVGTVTTASPNTSITYATNAESGGNVYVSSKNGGLKTSVTATLLTSATADLSSVSSGYGAQGSGATQSSGGPFSTQSPYNGASNNVGNLLTSFLPIFNTAGPVVGGSASVVLKAKSSATTPAASDYADTLTLVAAGSF